MAIIMQWNKALLIKEKSGTTSQGLNDHRGYGDLFIVITCQVNPSKTSKEITTILCFCMLKQHIISSRHTKQSQLFGTRHATAIITKNKVKTTPIMSC